MSRAVLHDAMSKEETVVRKRTASARKVTEPVRIKNSTRTKMILKMSDQTFRTRKSGTVNQRVRVFPVERDTLSDVVDTRDLTYDSNLETEHIQPKRSDIRCSGCGHSMRVGEAAYEDMENPGRTLCGICAGRVKPQNVPVDDFEISDEQDHARGSDSCTVCHNPRRSICRDHGLCWEHRLGYCRTE